MAKWIILLSLNEGSRSIHNGKIIIFHENKRLLHHDHPLTLLSLILHIVDNYILQIINNHIKYINRIVFDWLVAKFKILLYCDIKII